MMRQVYEDVNLEGAGDILVRSRLALTIPKCMYSNLSEQTLRPSRFKEQQADCMKAKVRIASVLRSALSANNDCVWCSVPRNNLSFKGVWGSYVSTVVITDVFVSLPGSRGCRRREASSNCPRYSDEAPVHQQARVEWIG